MLTDRRAECAALDRVLQRGRIGESAVLVLRGEAGIGKTAPAAALRRANAYLDAGVDCVYPICLWEADATRRFVAGTRG